MADIMIDIRGDSRSGLYAALSIAMPNITVATMTNIIAMYHGMRKVAIAKTVKYPAIMKMSPWAKLISLSMP
jgi:hypothetical protein